MAAWRYDIPVVLINDELAFKHRVDEASFEAWLLRGKDGTRVAPPGAQGE
jgi:hypothetical protein